jgi:hypothetical protein
MIEACSVDLPNINLSYFPNAQNRYFYRPERQLEKEHLQRIFSFGGSKMAQSDQSLLLALRDYLVNPSLDRQNREKTSQDQLFYLDGLSVARLENFFFQLRKN